MSVSRRSLLASIPAVVVGAAATILLSSPRAEGPIINMFLTSDERLWTYDGVGWRDRTAEVEAGATKL